MVYGSIEFNKKLTLAIKIYKQGKSLMLKSAKIRETTAKKYYKGPESGTLIQLFNDEIDFFEKHKTGKVTGKGVLCNRISSFLLSKLSEAGFPTSFIRRLNMREQLIRETEKLPIFLIIRNVAAGHFAKRLGLIEGTKLPQPLIEVFYHASDLDHPQISIEHLLSFSWFSATEVEGIINYTRRLNDFLCGFFSGINFRLVDMKIQFARLSDHDDQKIILDQDISPDSCRLWDMNGNAKDALGKELFASGRIYQELAKRLAVFSDDGAKDFTTTTSIQ